MPAPIDTTARDVAPEQADDAGFDYLPPAPEPNAVPEAHLPAVPEPAPLTGELPTVPQRGELDMLAQLAVTFAGAALVPKPLQGRPADCLLVLMTARDLGLSMTTAFRELHPIDGRVTASPKLRLAIVRQRGLGRVWPDPDNGADRATWHAQRADDPATTYSSTYTMADARLAGLTGKDNWKHYPARMLSWRALGYLLDDAFGEVGTGLYSADELGAVTDEDGQPVIDVTATEPLQGMVTAEQQARAEAAERRSQPADGADLWHLQARLHALPEAQQQAWRERKAATACQGTPSHQFTPSQLRLARGIVAGLESDAHRADPGWNAEAAAMAVQLAAVGPLFTVLCGGPEPEPHAEAEPPPPATDPAVDAAMHQLDTSMAAARTAAAEVVVKKLSVAKVRESLAGRGLPADGTAAECRDRLVAAMVAEAAAEQGQ